MRTRISLVLGALVAVVLPLVTMASPAQAVVTLLPTGQISISSTHTLMVDAAGRVLGAGDNSHSELGGAGAHPLFDVVPLPDGVKATAVAAGDYFSLALGDNGVPYGLGMNNVGQVAGASVEPFEFAPMAGLPVGVKAIAISARVASSLVLGDDGVVYGTGLNDSGQLTGVANTKAVLTPLTGLPVGHKATAISEADSDTLVLDSTGTVYGTGNNVAGQLSGGSTAPRTTLTEFTSQPGGGGASVAIAAGELYTIVVGDNGIAYGMGANTDHQLTGTGDKAVFTALSGLPVGVTPTGVVVGSSHTVISGSDGILYGTGLNADGQITGTGTKTTLTPMQQAAGPDVMGIAAGPDSTLKIDADHAVYGVGLNDNQQLTSNVGASSNAFVLLAGQLIAPVSAPVLSGTPKVGSVMSVSTGTWSPQATSYNYLWIRDGSPIAGGSSYKLAPADLGKVLTVSVAAHRPGFAADSPAVVVMTPVVKPGSAPVYVGSPKPAVTGIAKVGKTLRIKNFKASGFSPLPTAFKYQWFRNGRAIAGATKSAYKATSADKGKKISVRIYAVKTGYVTGAVTTAAVKVK